MLTSPNETDLLVEVEEIGEEVMVEVVLCISIGLRSWSIFLFRH